MLGDSTPEPWSGNVGEDLAPRLAEKVRTGEATGPAGTGRTSALAREGRDTRPRMAGNAAVTRWVRERGATPAPPNAAVQRAPQDGKSTRTKKALAKQKALAPNDPFVHTLHHIVPRSMLAAFAGHLTPAQRKLVVQLVGPHAKKAFPTPDDSLGAVAKALRSLPANVVLGPDPTGRKDDSGAQPDDNYADELTSEFVQPLIAASREHDNFAAGGVGLDRNRAAWSGDPARGRARRPAPLEPLL